MENHSTQSQVPNWPQDVGPSKGLGANSSPPWLWLVMIGLLILIFWHFVPKSEVQVSYAPWFLQQVEADNIQSLSIQGVEARGVLRQVQIYQASTSATSRPVRKFVMYFPSDASIEPIVQKLTSPRKAGSPPVQIEANPPSSAGGVAWIMVLLPTFVVFGLIYLVMRQARDRFGGPPRGQSP